MKTINWGIIGCGGIAKSFIKALKTVDNAKLLAVASNSAEKAKHYAEAYNVPSYYDNYLSLVSNPEIDVVYIANSHNYHFESALLCINNGKAVLCEKPLTINAKQTEKLITAAREKNVFLMEAMWTRFHPTIRKLKQILDDKLIGDIRLVTADFGFKTNQGADSRILNRQLAGGALLDVGIYPIHLASIVYGKMPVDIKSSAYIGLTGVDESSAYFFMYDAGDMAVLSSAVTYNTPRDATIVGSKGVIKIPTFFMSEKITVEIENSKPVTYKYPFRCNGYEYEIEEVCKCLRESKTESALMPWRESLSIMKLLDETRSPWNLKYPGEE